MYCMYHIRDISYRFRNVFQKRLHSLEESYNPRHCSTNMPLPRQHLSAECSIWSPKITSAKKSCKQKEMACYLSVFWLLYVEPYQWDFNQTHCNHFQLLSLPHQRNFPAWKNAERPRPQFRMVPTNWQTIRNPHWPNKMEHSLAFTSLWFTKLFFLHIKINFCCFHHFALKFHDVPSPSPLAVQWRRPLKWSRMRSLWRKEKAQGCQREFFTLPETNIAPKNGRLEYYFPIGEAYFQGLC